MSEEQANIEDEDLGRSPSRIDDPLIRREIGRAFAWTVVVGLTLLLVYIARPLLVVFGALVFAAMIDGGSRLIGKVLPIKRGWRVALVLLLALLFFAWLFYFAGTTVSEEATQFPALIQQQLNTLLAWAQSQGIDISAQQLERYAGSVGSGISSVTSALTGLAGGVTTALLILIIGIYVAVDPQLYERGMAWLVPRKQRGALYETLTEMAGTLRRLMAGRLLGMFIEGVLTYIVLQYGGSVFGIDPVPMASLLAILTGLLAFIPNLGAIVSGILMALVGFSGGVEMGIFTIAVYLFVQNFDGYVVVPMIAKKTVDLAPALVLAAQFVMGILFGIIGILLADPLLAMIKVALHRMARDDAGEAGAEEANDTTMEQHGA